MKSLHAAGHHITMIHPFPRETEVEDFTTINSRSDNTFVYIGQSAAHDFDLALGDFMDLFLKPGILNCHSVLNLPEIQVILLNTF